MRQLFPKIITFTKEQNIMSTIELKHHIIEKLSLIDDDSFLKAIQTQLLSPKLTRESINFLIFKRSGSIQPERK
jgi:hypothetical protein